MMKNKQTTLYSKFYKQLQFLGKGSYGRVFKVKQISTSKIYAAKRIQLQGMSPSQLQKTHKQIQIHQKLRHINILSLHQFYVSTAQIIMIVEYCEYGDLSYYIRNRKQEQVVTLLEEKFIMNIFIQIVYGLNYLHENKIVHRDIKPSNIFVDYEGRVKLADFGISSIIEGTASISDTKMGNIVGTPRYLSPEVCLNQQATFKSDIWALGCVLYELCTLSPAFEGNNILALAKMIAQQEVHDISSKYSSNLNALIHWMLQKQSSLRPLANQILQLSFIKEYSQKFLGHLPNKFNHSKQSSQNFPIISHEEQLMMNSGDMDDQERQNQESYHQEEQRIKLHQQYLTHKMKIEEILLYNVQAKQQYTQIYQRVADFHQHYVTVNRKDSSQIRAALRNIFGNENQELAMALYQMMTVSQQLQNL